MQIDYENMAKLIDIRMNQIYDAALEYDRFNDEYIRLQKIRNLVAEIIVLEREPFEVPEETEEKEEA